MAQALYRIPQYPERLATYENAKIMGIIHDDEDGFNSLKACIAFERSLQKEGNKGDPSEYIFLARAERMVAADIGL